MPQENVDRLRRVYQAFNSVEAKDFEAWDQFLAEFYDPDVEIHEAAGLRE